MSVKTVLFIPLFLLPLHAAVLIPPQEAMRQAFGSDITLAKKNVLLSAQQAATISKTAEMRLSTWIYRTYVALKSDKPVGYGVLITQKVRTKDAALLYMIAPDAAIRSIEVVAFNEPPEFIPSPIWLAQFHNKNVEDTLRVGKDIPSISGATMSARSVTDSARLALSIYRVISKESP